MEFLDSDNPIKGQLQRKSAHHREQLEEDVRLINEKTEKLIINALIIGGALAATYFIVDRFSTPKTKKRKLKKVRLVNDEARDSEQVVVESAEPEVPGVLSQLGASLATQATTVLLNMLQEKLTEFLESQNQKKGNAEENS